MLQPRLATASASPKPASLRYLSRFACDCVDDSSHLSRFFLLFLFGTIPRCCCGGAGLASPRRPLLLRQGLPISLELLLFLSPSLINKPPTPEQRTSSTQPNNSAGPSTKHSDTCNTNITVDPFEPDGAKPVGAQCSVPRVPCSVIRKEPPPVYHLATGSPISVRRRNLAVKLRRPFYLRDLPPPPPGTGVV